MKNPLAVTSSELGMVRVFALDMPAEQVQFLCEPGALAQVLGVDHLDTECADIFDISDLEGVGLAGYLMEGSGIPNDQITPDLARLDAINGPVLILHSRAFDGQPAALAPAKNLHLIGVYQVEPVDWTASPIKTNSAKPNSGAPLPPRQARAEARRIGGTVFAIFMAIIIAIVVLVVIL